jgi:hypothetical protein
VTRAERCDPVRLVSTSLVLLVWLGGCLTPRQRPPEVDGGDSDHPADRPSPQADAVGASDSAQADAPGSVGSLSDTPVVVDGGADGCGCQAQPNTEASCVGGRCVYACAIGYAACGDQQPETSGCTTSLSSPSSCGRCGRSCDGRPCTKGVCEATQVVTVLTDEVLPYFYTSSSFDGQELFYAHGNQVMALSKLGGRPRVVVADGMPVHEFAVLGDHVYWYSNAEGGIHRQLKTGGSAERVTGPTGAAYRAFGLVGNFLYWRYFQYGSDKSQGAIIIERASLPSGAVEEIVRETITFGLGTDVHLGPSVVFDEAGVFLINPVDKNRVVIRRRPASGASLAVLHEANAEGATLLTTDERYLYWSEGLTRTIKRIPKDGSAPAELLGMDPVGRAVRGIRQGADLFVFGQDHCISLPAAGGAVTIVEAPMTTGHQTSFGVDDRYVYWMAVLGTLWRAPR